LFFPPVFYLNCMVYIAYMTEYGHLITRQHRPIPYHPTDAVKEAKEARKKLLDQVEQRRKENYRRWYRKMRLQPDGDLL